MIALLQKEIRALLPIGAVAVLLQSGDILYRPILERLDEVTWTHVSHYIEPGESIGFIPVILALVIAYAAYPREHDERTIELLYALPIRRSSIFLAKVAAGLLVSWASVTLLCVTDALQSTLDPQSLSGHQWRLGLAVELAALQAVLFFVAYGHGLLASVLRLFGLIPYAIVLFIASILDDLLPPLAWVDPSEIASPRYVGSELSIPWTPIMAHLVVALFAYGLAYVAWMGPAERIGRALERARAGIAGKLAFGCAGAVAVAFIALIALALLITGGASDETASDAPTIETREATTERYVFSYPASLESRAQGLMAHADDLHEEVRRRLSADVGPELVCDLTDTSPEHLGISSVTHVRVGLSAEPDPVRLRRTFTHETAHVFQHRRSEGRLDEAGDRARFFVEGSAEYLALAIVSDAEVLASSRRIAVATWTRHRMRFEDLADDSRLRERFDPMLVYPLGELWTAALVDTCGERAIGDVLRAIGRGDAPRDLSARAYWEDRLRAAGCDLEAVLATFERMVRAIADRERASIDAIPRIGGGVAGRSGAGLSLVAVLDRDPGADARLYVRLRSGPDASDTSTVAVRGTPDEHDPRRVTFEVSSLLLASERMQVLFSAQPEPHGWAFSESWQWVGARPC